MLTLPDLNRLKVFYAVYQSRSLVGAAKALKITRSAVSQSLKALEEELGLKLFLRNSKQVLPTAPAEKLFRSLEPFFTELPKAFLELEGSQSKPAGHLRIGAPQDFGSTLLTEAIVEFRKKHPEITFELTLDLPVRLLELVSEGKLDLAFVDNGDLHAKSYPVSIATVMKEKFILVCARKYYEDKIKHSQPKLAELKELDFVDYLGHAPLAKIWLKHQFGKAVPSLKVSFSAESVRAVIRAAAGGMGLAVVPEHMVEQELKTGRLKELFPKEKPLINQITLARRLERTPAARESLFVSFVREFYGRSQSRFRQ